MKRMVLIGHRGVGKSALLERLSKYASVRGQAVIVWDLDREIEAHSGRSISDIFARDGESAFRDLERKVFANLVERASKEQVSVFVALGAGFDLTQVPKDWQALWLRRPSDQNGRIFTDRPRLDAGLSPLDEFRSRAVIREKLYRARADWILDLDEGDVSLDPSEAAFLCDEIRGLGGAITVLPEACADLTRLRRWIQARISNGVRWIELRDDLLSEAQIRAIAAWIPRQNCLLSYRNRAPNILELPVATDWADELGPCRLKTPPTVVSLHERDENLEVTLRQFADRHRDGVILKAALTAENFAELWIGEKWRREDPAWRAFLPMSRDGRWRWYRELHAHRMPIGFFREGPGSAADQPTLLQWLRAPKSAHEFAAVLGDPVEHSRSPSQHRRYFSQRQTFMTAIQVSQEEWDVALPLLKEMGLRWAAVTAPLKIKAFESCSSLSEEARTLRSVNTLWLKSQGVWSGTNTDLAGLKAVWNFAGETVVWGGGGTLAVILEVVPHARIYSARTGEPRGESVEAPLNLIWAAGRSAESQAEPPSTWSPQIVFDLNYADDSPAREYALKTGARYVSGLEMFEAQARAQQDFWSRVSPP